MNSRSSRSRSRAGIDRALGMRVVRVLERADDVEQRVGVAEPREMLGRQLLRPDVPLGRGGRRRQVDVGDVGLDDLLRLEDLGEPVEPLVGHLDDADVELHAAEAAGLGVAAGERVEDGRLARSGKPDDGDLHGAMLPVADVSSPRSDRRRSGAARRRRSGGGCRRTARRSGRGRGRSTTTCGA